MLIINMNSLIIRIYKLMSVSNLCHVCFHAEIGQFNILYINGKWIFHLFYFGPN